MSEEQSPKPEKERDVLEYRRLEAPPGSPGAAVGAMFAGVVISIVAVFGIGVRLFTATHPYFPNSAPGGPQRQWVPGLIFWGVGVSAIALCFYAWKARHWSRFFLLGLLIGCGIACLLEGACYVALS